MGTDVTGAASSGDALMSWINSLSPDQMRLELMKMGALPIPKRAEEAKPDDQAGPAVPASA